MVIGFSSLVCNSFRVSVQSRGGKRKKKDEQSPTPRSQKSKDASSEVHFLSSFSRLGKSVNPITHSQTPLIVEEDNTKGKKKRNKDSSEEKKTEAHLTHAPLGDGKNLKKLKGKK